MAGRNSAGHRDNCRKPWGLLVVIGYLLFAIRYLPPAACRADGDREVQIAKSNEPITKSSQQP
jgi:hypothetical protein